MLNQTKRSIDAGTSPATVVAPSLPQTHLPLEKSALPGQFREANTASSVATRVANGANERMDTETLTMVQDLTQYLARSFGVAAAGFGIASVAVEPLLGATWASGCFAAGVANLVGAGLFFLGSEITKIVLDHRDIPPRS